MDNARVYDIPVKGLAEGHHRFDFQMDKAFFASFENTEISGGSLRAVIEANRTSAGIVMDIGIGGTVTVECDRCLADCQLPVEFNDRLTVKISDTMAGEEPQFDGEIMWVGSDEGYVNIASYLYESVILSLPYQRVHSDSPDGTPGCDPDMLARFSIVSQEQFDKITGSSGEEGTDDPRWDKLRELKDSLEE